MRSVYESGAASGIPRIIHQIWIQGAVAVPERYRRAAETWRQRHPAWTYRLWDEPALREAILARAPGWWPIYSSQPEIVARADVARYALLQMFGGVYADMDTACVRPIDAILGRDASLYVTLYSKPRRARNRFVNLTNSVMATRAGHPLWSLVLDELERRHSVDIILMSRTGPYMLWPIVQQYAIAHPGEVRLLHFPHALTTAFLPRVLMHLAGALVPSLRVLDFNDGGRGGLVRALSPASIVRTARAAFQPRA